MRALAAHVQSCAARVDHPCDPLALLRPPAGTTCMHAEYDTPSAFPDLFEPILTRVQSGRFPSLLTAFRSIHVPKCLNPFDAGGFGPGNNLLLPGTILILHI